MALFLIATKEPNEGLEQALKNKFGDDVRRIAGGQWLVSSESPTRDLYEEIDTEGGLWGNSIIVTVGNYYGWNDPSIWEWIESKRSGKG